MRPPGLARDLLPDHTVFVSGGALSRESHVGARLQSEIYDPETNTWTVGAIASVVRMYHSIALLLPDGRVISAGGNPPPYGNQVPWEPPDHNEEMRLEVYSPPYLFAGPRPVISASPTQWAYGQNIVISTPQAGNIKWASIIRPGRHHPFLRQLPAARRPSYQRSGRRRDTRDGPGGGHPRAARLVHAVPHRQHRRAVGRNLDPPVGMRSATRPN